MRSQRSDVRSRPRENQNANQIRERDLLNIMFFLATSLRVTNMSAINNPFSFKGIRLKSNMRMLEAAIEVRAHDVTPQINAVSAGPRPVEGPIGSGRFH